MLYDILTELAQEVGRDLRDSSNRLWLVQQVNHAAREIYGTEDIAGCEREQVFNVGVSDQQIALPWYMDGLIGVRDYDSGRDVQQVDMRPRYSRGGWKKPYLQSPYLQWRQKGESALSTNLTDEAALTLSLPDGVVAVEAFTVYVVGSNSQAARVTETVTFAIGDRTKTTTNFFGNVTSIQKSVATTYDLNVYDVGSVLVSSIPSHLKIARFLLVQILNRNETTSPTAWLVEVLYKQRFEMFVNDTDTFTAGEQYEKVVYWKTLEHVYAKLDGQEGKAMMCGGKAQGLLNAILSNSAQNLELEIQFGRNPTLECFQRTGWQAVSMYAGPQYPGRTF